MIKKINKLFLLLGVILFSIVVIGCDEQNVIEDFQATYVETDFIGDYKEGLFKIVDNPKELIYILVNDTPEKYDEVFFDNHSLLVFRIVEKSKGIKSEIKSYKIKDNKITVNVEKIEKGDGTDKGYWWFILELTEEDAEKIKNVKIVKNKKVVIDDSKLSEIEKYTMQFDMSEEKTIWNGDVDEIARVDCIHIILRKTKTYPNFKLEYLNLEEAIGYDFSWQIPNDFCCKEEYRYLLDQFHQRITIYLTPQTKTRILEIVEELGKLDFVYLVYPSTYGESTA